MTKANTLGLQILSACKPGTNAARVNSRNGKATNRSHSTVHPAKSNRFLRSRLARVGVLPLRPQMRAL